MNKEQWEPTPCPTCLGFCGDVGPTCAEAALAKKVSTDRQYVIMRNDVPMQVVIGRPSKKKLEEYCDYHRKLNESLPMLPQDRYWWIEVPKVKLR